MNRQLIEAELALAKIQIEIEKRKAKLDWQVGVVDSLFPKQAAFVLSSARAKIAQCTRRAGKTHAAGVALVVAAQRAKGSTALYLALTRKSAKRLLWPKLKQLKRDFGVPLKFNESDLVAELPNGSQIMLYGADQENFVERLRGDAYSIVIIDEAASFSDTLDYAIQDVVEPALLDFQGTLAMIGSPGPVLAGPFFDACNKDRGYEIHKWSVLDNPHLPHAEKWIQELKRRRGWTDTNPTYLREYCNHWTEDEDALIYKFAPTVNEYSELPADVGHWDYILGVDLGFDDAATWAVIAFSDETPNAYIVHSEGHTGWIPQQWAAKTKALQDRYKPLVTVADAGALGKAIVEEMRNRYGLPIEAAEKQHKLANIELMNGDFQARKLFLLDTLDDLKHQYRILVKDKTGLREDPRVPNDHCVAKGSMIACRDRSRPIEQVEPGMEVMTRKGFRKVLRRIDKGWRDTLLVVTENGIMVSLTPDHLVLTDVGWLPAEKLQGRAVQWLPIGWNTEASPTSESYRLTSTMQELNTRRASPTQCDCIGWCGRTITALYQMIIMCITLMVTSLITALRISNCFQLRNTSKSTGSPETNDRDQSRRWNTWTQSEKWPVNGTKARMGASGTRNTIKSQSANIGTKLRLPVLYAGPNTRLTIWSKRPNGFARGNASQGSAGSQVKTILTTPVHFARKPFEQISMQSESFAVTHVALVTHAGKKEVFDIEIEGQHEFFAENILVSNCDSALYAYVRAYHYLHRPKDEEPEEGTQEWYDRQEQAVLQQFLEESKQPTNWWEGDII